jgi:hypothetical protein
MRKMKWFLIVLATLVAMSFLNAVTTDAQQAASLEVAMGAICRDVINREPVDVGTSFEASVGKLYCLTKITGAVGPTEITHVWYFGNTERARVSLDVNAASWRTYSSKIIQAHEVGAWHVDVLGPADELLQTFDFTITP